MKKACSIFLLAFLMIFSVPSVMAHCPLCTMGVGVAAVGAGWLGVSKVVIGFLVGAFAMSMGMWFAKLVKKKYIPLQKTLIILAVFFTTVLPLLPIFSTVGPLYIPFIGKYGLTYALNYSLAASFLGGLMVFISPTLSKKITIQRSGKTIPFQGVMLTLLLLILTSLIIQFTV